jgi:hypothetical protein
MSNFRCVLATSVMAMVLIVSQRPANAQQTDLQAYCSQQADARHLHGLARKEFRLQCKEDAAAPVTEPAAAPPTETESEAVPPTVSVTGAPSRGQKSDASPAAAISPAPVPNHASQPVIANASPADGSRRIALVIGNSAYKNVPALANPKHDAALVADAFRRTGFESVDLQMDAGRDGLVEALRNFAQQAERADWAVIYYAGHGMEVGGINYLIPVDAKIAADRDIGFEAVPLDQVLNAAERAKKLRLVILDACRDNPFANQMKRTMAVASRSVSRGLAPVEPEAGSLVVFAAKDGETALDGNGADRPFAMAFLKNLRTPGLEVRRLFDLVRDDVMDATQRKQKPFSYGSISGRQDFYFIAAK